MPKGWYVKRLKLFPEKKRRLAEGRDAIEFFSQIKGVSFLRVRFMASKAKIDVSLQSV
jgi:hypothetical protein